VEYYPCLQASTEDENVEEAGEEVLCVRAFGVSYMALGISIRSFMVPCRSQYLLVCCMAPLRCMTIRKLR
jgi:hypothetical protein